MSCIKWTCMYVKAGVPSISFERSYDVLPTLWTLNRRLNSVFFEYMTGVPSISVLVICDNFWSSLLRNTDGGVIFIVNIFFLLVVLRRRSKWKVDAIGWCKKGWRTWKGKKEKLLSYYQKKFAICCQTKLLISLFQGKIQVSFYECNLVNTQRKQSFLSKSSDKNAVSFRKIQCLLSHNPGSTRRRFDVVTTLKQRHLITWNSLQSWQLTTKVSAV